MSILVFLALLSADANRNLVYEDRVDIIEICHLYDATNRDKFRMDEIIFWKWQKNDDGEWGFHVLDWRQIHDGRQKYRKEKESWKLLPDPKPEFKPKEQILFELQEAKKPEHLQKYWEPPWIGSSLTPIKHGKYWICDFFEDGFHRRIVSTSFRETWTWDDPESSDRFYLSKKNRLYLKRLPNFMKDESAFFSRPENKRLEGILPLRE